MNSIYTEVGKMYFQNVESPLYTNWFSNVIFIEIVSSILYRISTTYVTNGNGYCSCLP